MENNHKQSQIGAHASIAKGFEKAVKSIYDIGGNAVQIFLKSPRGRAEKPLDEVDAQDTKKFITKNNIFLIGHSSYLLNFAKDSKEDSWPVDSLVSDMQKISQLGGIGVVLHIGKYLDMDKQVALNNIKQSVSNVIENTPKDVKVVFENTAGQGTEIGFRFDELAKIYDQFTEEQKERIAFCLDTCHSHAGGYDLSTKQGVLNWQSEFDKHIGWNKVVCIHLNDSKREAGSRVDRHEDIGYGTIGKLGILEIAKLANQTKIPLILETNQKNQTYREQIQTVKDVLNA